MNYVTYRNTYSSNKNYILTNVSLLWKDKRFDCIAMWDTAATRTHVSQKVIDLLQLQPIGETEIRSHRSVEMVKEYDVSLILPTNEFILNIVALHGDYTKIRDWDIDVIIGMDIIRIGDFHIDYTQERAVFTFRHPYDGDEDKLIETNLF